MSDLFRRAERGTRVDATRLVEAVPALMREAARRRAAPADPFAWALPRLAAATAAAVVLATSLVVWERSRTTTVTTFESLILEDKDASTGDVLFDALLDVERTDG
jgi:hypothetical protein